jgi:hypothetical protein
VKDPPGKSAIFTARIRSFCSSSLASSNRMSAAPTISHFCFFPTRDATWSNASANSVGKNNPTFFLMDSMPWL